MAGSRADRQVSPDEAFRAVYVDFEGFKGEAPVLVGRLVEYDFEQKVVDQRFYPVTYPSGCKFKEFGELIEETVSRCRDESRVLIGFTRHEVNKIEEYTEVDVRPIYKDAHKVAKRWINRLHREQVSEWTFDEFMAFMGYSKPPHFGDAKTTHRLRSVLNGLEAKYKETYEDLTPVQKAKWTKLLDYNRIDCLGMRDLVLRAASEIHASA